MKEYYFYLDSTPTHSYMRILYKYPQARVSVREAARGERAGAAREELEFELLDTGVFDENRYFDVFVEYAKASPEDILVRIEAFNRGPEAAPLHLLPTLWFRNTWSWGLDARTPRARKAEGPAGTARRSRSRTPRTATARCSAEGAPELLFTENETNNRRLFGTENDGTVREGRRSTSCVVHGATEAVNPARVGTKAAARYRLDVRGRRQSATIRLRSDGRECRPIRSGPPSTRFSRRAARRPTSSTRR